MTVLEQPILIEFSRPPGIVVEEEVAMIFAECGVPAWIAVEVAAEVAALRKFVRPISRGAPLGTLMERMADLGVTIRVKQGDS